MKNITVLFVTVAVLVLCIGFVPVSSSSGGGATSWTKFAGCLKAKLGFRALVKPKVICAATHMAAQFFKMSRMQCKNCDKYFHCQANYNAVARCDRHADAKRAAEAISSCREFSQGGTDADSRADDVANRHGRALNSCAKYLCASNCKYSPRNGSCKVSNC